LVEGKKKNILSVGKIADKVNLIVFTTTGRKIIEEDTRKVIAKGVINVDKLYVLKQNLGWNKR